MSFSPIIPYTGMAGWSFLQRTQEAQQAAFNDSAVMQRDVAYFRENIGAVETAEDLVSDYQLMKVALGAFGLDDDLQNKAYIRKILEEGSLDDNSFANRMVDKRYLAFTAAFGFDLGTPRTQVSDFADGIVEKYQRRQFEVAVGEQSSDMRLMMGLERDLMEIVESDNSDNGRWYAVMGNEPLRQVFETAMGLPREIAMIDIDKQVDFFREKSKTWFDTAEVSGFADPEKLDELGRVFLARSQVASGTAAMSSGSIALTLLQGRQA